MKKVNFHRIMALAMTLVMLLGACPIVTVKAMDKNIMPDKANESFWNQSVSVTSQSALNVNTMTSTVNFLASISVPDPNAIKIYTAQDLYNIRNNLSGSYVLANDIDLSEFNGGEWIPIGTSSNVFTGTIDGQGHVISNLKITGVDYSLNGLFGSTYNAEIKNIGLVNTYIFVTSGCAGGIVANDRESTIINCYNSGYISASNIDSSTIVNIYAGGIVGGISSKNTYIRECYNTAEILSHSTGQYSFAGGIIGEEYYSNGNDNNNSIINCYNTGNITSSSYGTYDGRAYVGGIKSNGGGVVRYCYNTGNVYSTGQKMYAGGISSPSGGGAWIDSCVTLSEIIMTTSVPGITILDESVSYIGGRGNVYCLALDGIYGNAFHDSNTDLISSDQAKSRTTYEYIGWDFDTIWDISPNINNGYPYLRNLHPKEPDKPSIINITPEGSHTILKGKMIALTAAIYENGQLSVDQSGITWTTSDSDIVSLSSNFGSTIEVEGKAVGKATITAAAPGGLSASCEVTVSDLIPNLSVNIELEAEGRASVTNESLTVNCNEMTFYEYPASMTVKIANIQSPKLIDGELRPWTDEELEILKAKDVRIKFTFPEGLYWKAGFTQADIDEQTTWNKGSEWNVIVLDMELGDERDYLFEFKLGSKEMDTTFNIPILVTADNIEEDIEKEADIERKGTNIGGKVNFRYEASGNNVNADYVYKNAFWNRDSDQFQLDTAQFLFGISQTAYSDPTNIVQSWDNTGDFGRENNIKSALDKLGFHWEKEFHNYNVTLNDSSSKVAFSLGRKVIVTDDNGVACTPYTLIAVSIRGGAYGAEWGNNALMGKSGLYHEGFNTAADEVVNAVWNYIDRLTANNEIEGTIKLWVTGYSRGGATANLTAAKLNNTASAHGLMRSDIYVYTFATPQGVISDIWKPDDLSRYGNIFNIVNPLDIVPLVAPSAYGFTRYGHTFYLCMDDMNPVTHTAAFLDIEIVREALGILTGIWKTVDSYVDGPQSLIKTGLISEMGSKEHYLGAKADFDKVFNDVSMKPLVKFFEYFDNMLMGMHNPAIYKSYLEKGLLSTTDIKLWAKQLVIACPVDISVYDKAGKLLASVVNDEIIVNAIPTEVNNGIKSIWLYGNEDDYNIKITATDNGAMSYSITEYDYDYSEVRRIIFNDVPLTKGAVYSDTITIGERQSTPSIYNLETSDGYMILPDEIFSGDALGNIKIQVNVTGNGIASAKSNITKGEYVKLYAISKEGATFLGWFENGEKIQDADEYSFFAVEDRTLEARFSELSVVKYTITATAGIGGNVSGGGVFNVNDNVTLITKPDTGYAFDGWYENNIKIPEAGVTYSFAATSNRTLEARFIADSVKYSLAVTSGIGGEITTGTSGNYESGTIINIVANPLGGYRFVNWTSSDGGSFADVNSANTTFTMPSNATTITANFEPISVPSTTYAIIATASTGGTVTGSGTYISGTQVTLTAQPIEGYSFDGWYENNVKINNAGATYTFIATANRALEASFILNEISNYTVTATASAGGTVSGGGSFASGTQATLTATPYSDYAFGGWYEGGVRINGVGSAYSFIVMSNRTIEARFTYIGSGGNGGGNTDGDNGGTSYTSATLNIKDARFDRSAPNDITVTLSSGSYSFRDIKNGIYILVRDKDYSVSGSTYTIKSGYLATLADSETTLVFNMSGGTNPTLVITIETSKKEEPNDDKVQPTVGDGILLNKKETSLKLNADGSVTITAEDLAGLTTPVLLSLPFEGGEISHTGLLRKDGLDIIIPFSVYMDGAMIMLVSEPGTYGVINNKKTFTDMSGHWAANTIDFITSRALYSGIGDNKFAPDSGMTRAMFATVLARLDGVDLSGYTSSVFTDVDINAWYGAPIAWAAEKGLVNGYGGGLFAPDDLITREQMAVMLNNYIKYKEIALEKEDYTPFADEDAISSWAKDAIVDIRRYGLINGVGDNIYAPKETANRASVAQIFKNFIEAFFNKYR